MATIDRFYRIFSSDHSLIINLSIILLLFAGHALREEGVRGDQGQRDGRVGQPGEVPQPAGRQANQAGGGAFQEIL